MTVDLRTRLGPVDLATPLVGASGTMGSVVEFAGIADLSVYGACVAKSVSDEPWGGRPAPRLAPAGVGMLNGIGIQNPGIEAWIETVAPGAAGLEAPVWGSVVGHRPPDFARVASRMAESGIPVIEVNLSCPNLDDGRMFALDADRAAEVVHLVREAVDVPIGAKLSPDAADVAAVAAACAGAGADWVVLTNTVRGAGIDLETGRPLLSGVIGGYSGIPIKPIAIRCVLEVRAALPGLPILGCGGVATGEDVAEYLMAGASAVAIGTVHFAEPKAGSRILRELRRTMERLGVTAIEELRARGRAWA